jgi:predicted nucleic acid-binding protein
MIYVPRAVYEEVTESDRTRDLRRTSEIASITSAHWMKVIDVRDRALVLHCRASLDQGESEAIALAKELDAELLIIDERKGRAMAKRLGRQDHRDPRRGAGGEAERSALSEVKPVLLQLASLQERARFHVTPSLIAEIIQLAGE